MIARLVVALLFIGFNLYVFRYFASEDVMPPARKFCKLSP